MENQQPPYVVETKDYSIREFNDTLSKTFTRMFIGLLVTALSAIVTYRTSLILYVAQYYWLLAIAEIIMVLVFSFGFKKLSPKAVTALYYGYAILNGVTLSTIFIVYGIALIGKSFVMTSILFGALAYLGHSTDKDLTKMGTVLLAALVVGLIATIVNLFMQSSMLSIILDWAMLFIFSGLTIYDMNKMKMMSQTIPNDTASQEKLYIYCAMELYLDFINIFLRILRILGRANKK